MLGSLSDRPPEVKTNLKSFRLARLRQLIATCRVFSFHSLATKVTT